MGAESDASTLLGLRNHGSWASWGLRQHGAQAEASLELRLKWG